jgi:outer membrane protein, heavy metal efflux system
MFGIPVHTLVVHFPNAMVALLAIFAVVALRVVRKGATPRRAWAVPLTLAAGSAPAGAQTSGRPPLTVVDAVAFARARHPALAAASARRESVVAFALQESAFPNPVLEVRRENLGSPLERDEFATIAQPIDLTGRRLALRAGARDLDRRALADSATTLQDIEAGAARAFWRASLASALLTLAEDQRVDAERLARVEADRAREGAAAEVVAMRTSVEHDRALVAEASARAEWMRSRADLARAIGVYPDSLPQIDGLAPGLARMDAAPALGVLISHALARRSELASLRAAQAAASHRVSAERRGAFSDVVLEAGTKHTAGYSTRVIAVAVPLPLFNRNTAARDRAAAERQLVEAELRVTEQTVRAQVASALESYRALLAAQPSGIDSLVSRVAEVARIADAAYADGGGSLLELLDARRARAETLGAALRWVADVQLAHLDLLRAVGASPLDSLELL